MTIQQLLHTAGLLLIVMCVAVFGATGLANAQNVHALLIILGNDGDIRASIEKNESSMQTLLRQVSENCEVHLTVMKSETETIGKITRMTLSNTQSTNITQQTQGIISAKQVVQWLRNLRSNSEDTILIYYSGHGSMDAVGTHILNFDPEVTNDFVARDGLRKRLEQKQARLKMLITDTCSNRVQTPPPIARVYAKVQSRERRYTKNLFLEHSGFLDLTAASEGQYAWGNDEIGGYFTVSLIGSFTAEADANQDRFLSWKEVFDVTRSKTRKLFSETTFLLHNQRKLDEAGQTNQTPAPHTLPEKLTPPSGQRPPQLASRARTPRTIIGKDGTEMAFIPAGEFQMGNRNRYGANNNEKPVHTVYVDAFYIDKYEVTNAKYVTFLNAKGKHTQHGLVWLDLKDERTRIEYVNGRYRARSGYANHPVIEVSWYGAMAYAQWAGKRLPTEAEWEKAARGNLVGQKYPPGNYAREIGRTTSVGKYTANGYGLHDMVGNVWEWCLDAYDSDFYRHSPRRNPIAGANSIQNVVNDYRNVKTIRVLRGGSWASDSNTAQVTHRYWTTPSRTFHSFGFRCVTRIKP